MPDRLRTGEGAIPTPVNALFRRGEGYGWIRGCGVTFTDNTSAIEIRVGPGRVRAGGSFHEITETTKQLGDGDAQNPRRDLVGVDYQGDVRIIPGDPAPPDPADREGEFLKQPQPPSTASFDGTLLAEVFVPAETTSNAGLTPDDIADRRVADGGGLGSIPVVDARPAEADLVQTRWWYNTNAGQFEAFIAASDEIVAFDTTQVTSFTGDTTRVVERFDSSIKGNWRGGDSEFEYTTPAFEGSASAYWDGFVTKEYSLPGDGLDYYAEPGDTVTMAVRSEGADHLDLGFAKSTDDFVGDYRCRLDVGAGELQLVKTTSDGSETILGDTSVNISSDTWYWLEVDYDGGGQGIHPCRLYSTDTATDPGTTDTELASITSPTADTTHRGRGYAIEVQNTGRIDYLTAVTS